MSTSPFFAAFLRRSVFFGALLLLGSPDSHAQTGEAQAHHAAIEAFYPVMIGHANAGRLTEARTLCQQAIAWEPSDPVHHYNLACIESKAGRLNQGFAALGQATSYGYADANSLRTDPDLAALRADSRFSAVLKNAARNTTTTATPAPAATVRPVSGAPARLAALTPARPVAAPARVSAGPAVAPAPAAWRSGKLQGLFFMTRFWIFNNSLETAVWYFAPNGRVYHNLEGGFSAAELAADKARKGTYSLVGSKLSITWADGKTNASKLEPDASGFGWDAGIFAPVKSFASARALVGKFEGGASISGGSSVSKSLDLRADGTYSRYGVASLSSTSVASTVSASSQGGNAGRWVLSGYTLTLTDAQGKVTLGIAFPFDDSSTAVYPDRFYFAGTMYKKQ